MSRSARTAQGRYVEPIRQHAALGPQRRALIERWDEVSQRRDQIDAEFARLARERHELQRERSRLRERIWPRWLGGRGRRRPEATRPEHTLPALPVRPRLAWGRALRDHALRVLSEVGVALSLVELHRLLHLRGVAVDSDHPAKSLADALGYEAEQGRAERVRRGWYRIRPGT
ncbi:MAG: hypothetical protein GEV08_05025 [Acidimicrobiia bacterium]|nr:hypothetical protein [Acidimicrobiia bacterium]